MTARRQRYTASATVLALSLIVVCIAVQEVSQSSTIQQSRTLLDRPIVEPLQPIPLQPRLPFLLPNQVKCATDDPGVRCLRDPCAGATCIGYPDAVCIPNFCRSPREFLGITTGPACTPVFADPLSGKGIVCDAALPTASTQGDHCFQCENNRVTMCTILRCSNGPSGMAPESYDFVDIPSKWYGRR